MYSNGGSKSAYEMVITQRLLSRYENHVVCANDECNRVFKLGDEVIRNGTKPPKYHCLTCFYVEPRACTAVPSVDS